PWLAAPVLGEPAPPAPCANAKLADAAKDSAAVNVSSFFMFNLLRGSPRRRRTEEHGERSRKSLCGGRETSNTAALQLAWQPPRVSSRGLCTAPLSYLPEQHLPQRDVAGMKDQPGTKFGNFL